MPPTSPFMLPFPTTSTQIEPLIVTSAMSLDSPEDGTSNPRFTRLQEELREVVISGVSNFGPSLWGRPEEDEIQRYGEESEVSKTGEDINLTLSNVNIPLIRAARYLQNWVTECAPLLDKFDQERHFQIQVPILAQRSLALLYAVLAFSSKHMERRGLSKGSNDSLELYQESITLLGPTLKAKEPNVLVTACVLAVFELMSGSSKNWRRHLEGCAALFGYFGVHGFSGGLLQAVFWCFARMDLCGSILAGGAESMTLPLAAWHPAPPTSAQTPEAKASFVQYEFHRNSHQNPDVHANWSVYLCAKVCDLRFRRTQALEAGHPDLSDPRPFKTQWKAVWDDLAFWRDERPAELIPVADDMGGGNNDLFPRILFAHWAAISSNQLYHTACILMLEMRPRNQELPAPEASEIWHARRVCGISANNPHRGSLVNAIQPLYVAGRLFTHPSERREIARLLKLIDSSTGWGALWRLRDLEAEWGEEYSDMPCS